MALAAAVGSRASDIVSASIYCYKTSITVSSFGSDHFICHTAILNHVPHVPTALVHYLRVGLHVPPIIFIFGASDFDEPSFQALIDVLRSNTSLHSVDVRLAGWRLHPTRVLRMVETISQIPSLTCVCFSGYGLSRDAMDSIVRLVDTHRTFKELELQDNHLDDACIERLAAALSRSTTLELVDVGENPFGEVGVIVMLEMMLVNRSITSLHMCNANLTPRSAKKLADVYRANFVVHSIDLAYDDLGRLSSAPLFVSCVANTACLPAPDIHDRTVVCGPLLHRMRNPTPATVGSTLRLINSDMHETDFTQTRLAQEMCPVFHLARRLDASNPNWPQPNLKPIWLLVKAAYRTRNHTTVKDMLLFMWETGFLMFVYWDPQLYWAPQRYEFDSMSLPQDIVLAQLTILKKAVFVTLCSANRMRKTKQKSIPSKLWEVVFSFLYLGE